jgi:hypothetical protein
MVRRYRVIQSTFYKDPTKSDELTVETTSQHNASNSYPIGYTFPVQLPSCDMQRASVSRGCCDRQQKRLHRAMPAFLPRKFQPHKPPLRDTRLEELRRRESKFPSVYRKLLKVENGGSI